MKIGFIGCGNMAKSIIEGILSTELFEKDRIFASAADQSKLQKYCENIGIHACENEKIATLCDVILLCVKPQKFPVVLPEIASLLREEQVIISIAAGKTIAYIQEQIGNQKIIRVMPNLNAKIKQSASALCANALCNKEDIKIGEKIFDSIGKVFRVDEGDFSAFSAVACCSPAFSFMYMDALAKEGIACGLDTQTAYAAALYSVKASASLLDFSDESPQVLVDKVCSPGGTTIEGVKKLEEFSFEQTVREAVHASYLRDKEL